MFRSYGHQFLYDADTLRAALSSAGFEDIIQLAPDESPDENLRGIDAHERLIGKEMNRLETMVFEVYVQLEETRIGRSYAWYCRICRRRDRTNAGNIHPEDAACARARR